MTLFSCGLILADVVTKNDFFLLQSFKTHKEQNGADIFAQFENMSRCFPVSLYLARQVSDA